MTERLREFADTGNVVRFLLSFVLAFALWAWVTADNDPEQTYRATQVPVDVRNLPNGLELVSTLPAVDVTLQGPRSVIQTIDAGSIDAWVDLGNVDSAGNTTQSIEIDAPDGIRKVTTNPEEIPIELGAVSATTMKVEALTPAEMPRNLSVTRTTVTPDQVTVTAVQQNIDRIARVIVPVEVEGQTDSFSFQAAPVAVDASNQPIENIEISPERVDVQVEVEIRGKVVPVFVDCVCQAAPGYAVLGQPLATPSTVVVDGPREALDQINYLYTTPVNTSDLSAPKIFEDQPLDIESLPDGIRVEPALVDVSVRVEQSIFTETFGNVPVEVLNADSENRVVVSPAAGDITIQGPRDEVSRLTDADIAVVVDVAGLGPGTHQLQPLLLLPPRMGYIEPPPQVVVTIIEVVPTPAPSPTRTPTTTVDRPTPTVTRQP